MFESIGIDNFQSEVLEQNRPVILAYIRRDYQYKEQTDVLNNISKRFGDAVKICLIEGESAGILRRLKIGGAPAFLIFYRGKDIWQKYLLLMTRRASGFHLIEC